MYVYLPRHPLGCMHKYTHVFIHTGFIHTPVAIGIHMPPDAMALVTGTPYALVCTSLRVPLAKAHNRVPMLLAVVPETIIKFCTSPERIYPAAVAHAVLAFSVVPVSEWCRVSIAQAPLCMYM